MKKPLFSNPSLTLWKRYTKSERQGRFAGIFQDQDFGDANLKLYRVAVLASYFCNLISIATGFAFVYLLLSELYADLPDWLRYLAFGVVSSVFLVFLEYLKRETIGNNAVSFLKHKKANIPSLLIIVSLISISVSLSVKGAEQFIRKVDQSVEFESKKQEETLETRGLAYEKAIQSQQDSLNAFKNSVSWKGKINVSNKVVAATLSHFLGNMERLEKEKLETLGNIQKQSETRLQELKQKTESRADYMVWIALGNEVSCILLILWVYYYAFRSHVEYELAKQKPENFNHFEKYSHETAAIVKSANLNSVISTPQMKKKPIGFEIKAKEKSPHGRCEQHTVTILDGKGEHTQGFKIECGYCGKEAIKFNKNARFCSETCRNSYHAERYREKRDK